MRRTAPVGLRPGAGRVFEIYYFLTPVFWLIDVVLHAPVRAAAIESEAGRWAYYVLLVGIGVACRLRPGWAPLLGLVEGSTNLLFLFLSILLPVWNAAVVLPSGGEVIGLSEIANVAISGSMTVLAIKRAEWQLFQGTRRSGR